MTFKSSVRPAYCKYDMEDVYLPTSEICKDKVYIELKFSQDLISKFPGEIQIKL